MTPNSRKALKRTVERPFGFPLFCLLKNGEIMSCYYGNCEGTGYDVNEPRWFDRINGDPDRYELCYDEWKVNDRGLLATYTKCQEVVCFSDDPQELKDYKEAMLNEQKK